MNIFECNFNASMRITVPSLYEDHTEHTPRLPRDLPAHVLDVRVLIWMGYIITHIERVCVCVSAQIILFVFVVVFYYIGPFYIIFMSFLYLKHKINMFIVQKNRIWV